MFSPVSLTQSICFDSVFCISDMFLNLVLREKRMSSSFSTFDLVSEFEAVIVKQFLYNVSFIFKYILSIVDLYLYPRNRHINQVHVSKNNTINYLNAIRKQDMKSVYLRLQKHISCELRHGFSKPICEGNV